MNTPTQALCCECGNVRTLSPRVGAGQMREPGARVNSNGVRSDAWGRARCTVSRKCGQCRAITTHAYLRGADDKHRDMVEVLQYGDGKIAPLLSTN